MNLKFIHKPEEKDVIKKWLKPANFNSVLRKKEGETPSAS